MKIKTNKDSPQLRMIATSWTFMDYPDPQNPWSPEKIVSEIKKAGFDGVQTGATHPVAKLAHQAGLEIVCGQDFDSLEEVQPKLQAIRDCGAIHVNVQLCDHDTPLEKALPIAIKIIEVGDQLQLKPAIEWHRDTCTETPEKALALAEAYEKTTSKKLRMNFDHSHPAIIKHLRPSNYWERLAVRLDLLQMSDLLHLRPFNGHHCQIPITDGQGNLSPEFQDWLPFCEKLLEVWIQSASSDRVLYLVPELGPKGGYGLSCFPDCWKDKQVAAQKIQKIWNRQIKNWKAKES